MQSLSEVYNNLSKEYQSFIDLNVIREEEKNITM